MVQLQRGCLYSLPARSTAATRLRVATSQPAVVVVVTTLPPAEAEEKIREGGGAELCEWPRPRTPVVGAQRRVLASILNGRGAHPRGRHIGGRLCRGVFRLSLSLHGVGIARNFAHARLPRQHRSGGDCLPIPRLRHSESWTAVPAFAGS